MRTDRSLSFYDGDENPNVYLLRDILLSYSFYNFDLGYCQVVNFYYVTILPLNSQCVSGKCARMLPVLGLKAGWVL